MFDTSHWGTGFEYLCVRVFILSLLEVHKINVNFEDAVCHFVSRRVYSPPMPSEAVITRDANELIKANTVLCGISEQRICQSRLKH
jgi:hypothetical protein